MTWTLASTVLLGLALVAGFAWWERSRPPSRVLALVATLAALAALGRVAFAPLPNVKPTTDIVLFAGYALGGAPGFVVGAVAALASNFFFGQGPWTPWQMVGWGGVGLLGAALAAVTRGRPLGRISLAVACGVAGAAFGVVMNVHLWVTYGGDHSLARLGAYQATSLPFDAAHVIGNVLFCLAFGPALVAALRRYRARLEVRWVPAAAAAAVALAVVPALAVAPATAEAAVTDKPAAYLVRAQNADGGFGDAPGRGSSGLHTAWAALGLAAAGRNPADVVKEGNSAVDYLQGTGDVSDLGEVQRTVLVLAAAGRDPRSFGGRDLVARLVGAQERSGAYEGRVNTTAFSVLALRAAGKPASTRAVARAATWIAGQRNPDGGFNFAGKGGRSGVDDTSAAVQALAAAGRGGTAVRRAVRFLSRAQNPDGGFPLEPGGASNAQSTAWAMQALLAAGRDPDRLRTGGSRTPRAYLRSLITGSGAVRYSRTSAQTPVWVTGQALTALARKPFPLARVPRARRAGAPAAPAPAPTAAPEPDAAPERTPTPTKKRSAKRRNGRSPTGVVEPQISLSAAGAGALARHAGALVGVAFAVLV